MKEKQQNDLGRDPVRSLMFRLALPAILAQLINALYNIVDRIYIGNMPHNGDMALTGVGVTFPILMVISAFSAFIGMGGAPRVAIKMGEGRIDEAEHILGNSFISLLGISAVLTTVFLIWGEPLLMMFGASDATIGYALEYMNIYVMGTLFVQLALGLNSFISTQGFATQAMITVLVGAGMNITLDPLFIFVFDLGVRGAAIATVVSQAVSAAWVVFFLLSKRTLIKIRPRYFRLKSSVMLPVMALGLSPFIMQSTESLVNIVLNSSLQKYGGDPAVGAMTIVGSVMQFCLMPLQGLTQSAQPIIGFNYGACQIGRVKQAFRYLLISSLTYAALLWGLAMLFPQMVVALFAKSDSLFQIGVWAMRIYMAGAVCMGAQFACQQTFVALGQAKTSLLLALLRKIVLLIPLAYILPHFFTDKVFAVFLAEPVADVLAATTTVIVFSLTFGKILKKRITENAAHPEKTESV